MRRINSSNMNVSSNTAPLDELMLIESVGGRKLQQWYFVNLELWSPERKTTPLILRPSLQLTDPDSHQVYTVDMSDNAKTSVKWYYKEGNGKETRITNTVESQSADYTIKSNGDLVVRKNVSNQSPVILRCEVEYTDPRNFDKIKTDKSVTLTTNQDAIDTYDVHIIARNGTEFSPLNGDSPTKIFYAKAYLGVTDVTEDIYSFYWYTVVNNSEVLIDTLLGYVSGQNTTTLTLNADYCESPTEIILRLKTKETDTKLDPARDTVTLSWRIPRLSTDVYSINGDSVNQSTQGNMTFKQTVRTTAGDIPEEIANKYLYVEWSKRNSAGGYSSVGSGTEMTLPVSGIKNNNYTSTLVKADVYLREHYVKVTQRVPVTYPYGVVQEVNGETLSVTQDVNGVTYEVTQDVVVNETWDVVQDGKTVVERT